MLKIEYCAALPRMDAEAFRQLLGRTFECIERNLHKKVCHG